MKKVAAISIYQHIIFVVFLIITFSCKKNDSSISQKGSGINFNKDLTYGSMTDQEGNVYKTIKIGLQTWMAENLRTTKYRNGERIANITDDGTWDTTYSGAYCWYNNDSISNRDIYGALYNFYAVNDSRNIAPIGWHIPTDTEWTTLTDYLAGSEYGALPGYKMREDGSSHWYTIIGTGPGTYNESGFTGLPGGNRNVSFSPLGLRANFWSSTFFQQYGEYDAWYWMLYYDNARCGRDSQRLVIGASVRCIMN